MSRVMSDAWGTRPVGYTVGLIVVRKVRMGRVVGNAWRSWSVGHTVGLIVRGQVRMGRVMGNTWRTRSPWHSIGFIVRWQVWVGWVVRRFRTRDATERMSATSVASEAQSMTIALVAVTEAPVIVETPGVGSNREIGKCSSKLVHF